MPTTFVGIIAVVAAFAPGYVWVRVSEARTLRVERSPLLETAELGLVGATATLFAATLVGLAGDWGWGFARFGSWARDGSLYLERHPVQILITLSSIVALSTVSAWVAARIRYWKYPPMFGPQRTVWSDVLAGAGVAVGPKLIRSAFIAARMKDDRILEGYLFSYPAGSVESVAEIALQAPIYVRDSPASDRVKVANIQFLILLIDELKELAVQYHDVPILEPGPEERQSSRLMTRS